MSHLLPPNLLRLFAPRPHPPFLKPLTRDERSRGPNKLSGVAHLAQRIKEEAEDAEVKLGMEVAEKEKAAQASEDVKPDVADAVKEEGEDGEVKEVVEESGKKRKKAKDKIAEMGVIGEEAVKMRKELRKKRQEEYKKNAEKTYKPQDDPSAIGDPYKTLFIARLSKKATETDLQREFEMYGPIERIRIVRDRKGKSTGYAFIVYERERDMKAAYKDAEGIPVHHKKILVDVERGRTVKGWKPQRLGGGLGGRPKPIPVEAAPVLAPSGGFRGGRGGFRGGARGGGFRGGFQGGNRGGFGGGDRGFNGGGDRGGFGGRGGFRGGFQGNRGGFGGDRGGFGGGDRGGFQGGRGGYGANQGGAPGGFGGDSGYGGGGGFQQQNNGYQGGGNFGGQGGGFKRDFDNAGGPGGYQGGGGGFGGSAGGGGYQDRDPKRMRY
ncbi:hypothetical protein I350_01952 [Cryptococcus amylolentus CBS 6273]|uniref:RRM domain-containing protein n=1 Tax=Cryptococcus amylolentus CBS 6273 TaxID=1296118 RepID=A0A1E3K9W6_9TREE|nr:hypothetical protein I350_01952 [Cryptococcus amylolentus CBS 6273]